MTNPQNYVAVPMPPHVDITATTGVNYKVVSGLPVTPAVMEVQRIMQTIRSTGKCGMFVARWDGSAWCFHVCDAPARVNEI